MQHRLKAMGLAAAFVVALPVLAEAPTGDLKPRLGAASVDAGVTTGSIAARMMIGEEPAHGGAIETLKNGLDALASGDIEAARGARDGLPAAALDRHILAWAIALSGDRAVTSGEIADAAAALPGWPGMEALRRNRERAIAREAPDAPDVLRAFGGEQPLTVDGTIVLARAHLALGQEDEAGGVLSPFWRTEKLEAADEAAVIREFGDLIPATDHRFRMERMLYAERIQSAERVAKLADAEALAKAWAAVLRNDKTAGALLDAVPAAQRSAGYAFAKAKHLRRNKERFTAAAEIMLAAPRDAASLVDPDAWWIERRVLSRELLDIGKAETAYRIAAAHSAESPGNAADAEFHAGWYALRSLGDIEAAYRHFAAVAELSSGAISQARGYYWLGRTAEAGGPGDAKTYYTRAAAYGTTFYGQLAAAKLKLNTLSAHVPETTAADRRSFALREAVAAIRRLEQAGHGPRADILYRDLAGQLTSPGELSLLAEMAESKDNHFLALRVGKIAAARGIDVGALSHPVGAIPDEAAIEAAGKALAYAIARQESEFNVGAVSGAGARGLLQLMPATAAIMAKQAGLEYSRTRLTTDAAYNATLGSVFLGQQLGRFSGSYVLTFAGYNAGPNRAREWIGRYGDPRGKSVEAVVDWIERIPYAETRNYVQRVMENYQVYKMRLSGRMDIEDDLVNGR